MFASGSVSSWLHILQQGRALFTPTKPVYTAENQTKEEEDLFISALSNQSRLSMDGLSNACPSETFTRQKETETMARVWGIKRISWNYQYLPVLLMPGVCLRMSERHYWPWRVCQKVPAERTTILVLRELIVMRETLQWTLSNDSLICKRTAENDIRC